MARARSTEEAELGARVYFRTTLTKEPPWSEIFAALSARRDLLGSARFELDAGDASPWEANASARVRADMAAQLDDAERDRAFANRTGIACLGDGSRGLTCVLSAGERCTNRVGEIFTREGVEPRMAEAANCVSLTLRGESAAAAASVEPLAELVRDLGSIDGAVIGSAWLEPRPIRRILGFIETHVACGAYTSDWGPHPPAWLLLLGREYADALRERLDNAPCAQREVLRSGAVLLRVSERPAEAELAARALMRHVGKEWFNRGAWRRAKRHPAIDWSGSHYTSA